MRANSITNNAPSHITRFALGQTFITPGAQEAIQIAGPDGDRILAPSHVL